MSRATLGAPGSGSISSQAEPPTKGLETRGGMTQRHFHLSWLLGEGVSGLEQLPMMAILPRTHREQRISYSLLKVGW